MMKDILVAVGGTPSAFAAADAAVSLAATFGARLTAVYASPSSQVSSVAALAAGPALLDEIAREVTLVEEQVHQRVGGAAAAAGVELEWMAAAADTLECLLRCAHSADLIVVGRKREDGSDGLDGQEIARLVTEAGRPVLVVPPGFGGGFPSRRVMVGWNGSRGASRALHDALPFLRRADSVSLVIVGVDWSESPSEEVAASLRAHLARHGVVAAGAKIVKFTQALGVNGALINSAPQETDLIVMGAFGRPRLRQFALGSVTAAVIENAPVPVLLSY